MAIKQINVLGTTHDVHDARVCGIDSAPTSGSGNLVTSGGVYTALQNAPSAPADPYYGLMGFIGDGFGDSQTTAATYQELISKEYIYDDDSDELYMKVQSVPSDLTSVVVNILDNYHAISLDWVGVNIYGYYDLSDNFVFCATAYLVFFIDGDGDYYYAEYDC